MKTPGITVRPLVLLNGHRHFNEVFFDDVAVPKANLIGRQNEGWKLAMTTLMYERKGGGGRGHEEQLARLRALAMTVPLDGRPAWEHPVIRQRFAQLVIEAQCQRYTRMRNLTRQLRGRAARARGLDPQALRLRAGRAHRRLRGRAARPARAREPARARRCPTARAGTTAC